MNSITRLTCSLALTGGAWGQVSQPAFEVATIKRADPTSEEGLMIRDPRIVGLAHVSLQNLLAQAYRIKNFQISGPGWLSSERFDIVATLPEGASRDQLPAMFQTLLRERFKLALHEERRNMSAYVLRPARGGVKLKAINAEVGDVHTSTGAARRLSGKVTMTTFAGLLSNMLDRPVVDGTEVKGVYDIDLEWSVDDAGTNSDSMPSLSTILQEKLGLRLESRKTPVDFYVIDHVERVPTEN
ncbi:MAG TPA: TIGR03435 family protein [Bryobacteraceae bacterium]|nr:TIGR03435 family protein [Bryobacteraceae bacterium]